MTDRELMQMALDALDKLLDKLNADICDNSGIWDEYCDGGNAMQALRARLAQPEPDDGYCQACEGNYCTAKDGCVALDNSRAQPEQEPQGGYRWREGDVPPSITYTTPPQREWQGLTNDEIMDACSAVWASHPIEVGQVVAAILKEKNGF